MTVAIHCLKQRGDRLAAPRNLTHAVTLPGLMVLVVLVVAMLTGALLRLPLVLLTPTLLLATFVFTDLRVMRMFLVVWVLHGSSSFTILTR